MVAGPLDRDWYVMKIQLRTLWAGPDGVHQPGEVINTDRKRAKELLESRQAVPVKDVSFRTATAPSGETATED